MGRPPLRCAAALALALAGGCGDDAGATASADAAAPAAVAHDSGPLLRGDVRALLAALAQSHASVRAAVGPHRLTLHTITAIAPVGEPTTSEPKVDEPRPIAQAVDDRLELVWATTQPNMPSFSLAQTNDHDRGREIVVDGGVMYTRARDRAWYQQPLQVDVFELWLDDAQHAVHDAIELAAPRLSVSASESAGAGLAGGGAIVCELSLAPGTDATLVPAGERRAWRGGAEITDVRGRVVVDAGSGAWLSADVQVAFGMPGPDGRPLTGSLAVTGTVEPGAGALVRPQGAAPLLERTRYAVERSRLLDGLAGP